MNQRRRTDHLDEDTANVIRAALVTLGCALGGLGLLALAAWLTP